MPLYCTPDRFRISGFGLDLSKVPDIELRSILTRASATVNSYCNVPTRPIEHDFRGGVIVDEKGNWSIGNYLLPGQRRYYPFHKPVISVQAMRLLVTNTQYNAFNAGELFVAEDFIEVVSLAMTQVGLFGAGIFPNIGLEQPQLNISYTYGSLLPAFNEELEVSDGKTFRAQNQWWSTTPAPVIRINGAVETTGFTIDSEEGTVTLTTVTATTRVNVDYYHRLAPPIAEATAVIAADRLGDRALTRRGMHGLQTLTIGEVQVRRPMERMNVGDALPIPIAAASLLDPYRFISVRGGSF